MVRAFASGRRDQGSIQIPVVKIQKIVLDASLLNTQYYKVRIKCKQSNPRKGVAPSLHPGVVAVEKETFRSPLTTFGQLTLCVCVCVCIDVYMVV